MSLFNQKVFSPHLADQLSTVVKSYRAFFWYFSLFLSVLEVCNLLDFCKLPIKILLAGVGHRFSAPAIGTSAPVGARAAARKQQQGGGCDQPFRRGRGLGSTRDEDLYQLSIRICINSLDKDFHWLSLKSCINYKWGFASTLDIKPKYCARKQWGGMWLGWENLFLFFSLQHPEQILTPFPISSGG